MVDFYYGNFSVFQSLPDSWAIRQLFPVMPLHRLNERPTNKAVLADITCDCDGKIDQFIDREDVATALPLHAIKPGEDDYYIGVFLVGAYQETRMWLACIWKAAAPFIPMKWRAIRCPMSFPTWSMIPRI